jgi:hypothetical protein
VYCFFARNKKEFTFAAALRDKDYREEKKRKKFKINLEQNNKEFTFANSFSQTKI